MADDDHPSTPTPSSSSYRSSFLLRSTTATKRDSLAADLEHDPQVASAKRAHRTQTQVFTSSIAHAGLERQLVALKTAKVELEGKLRERDLTIERLERDRRWLVDREETERAEKERERAEREAEKIKSATDLRTLRSTLSALREAHEDLEEAHATLSRTSARTAETHNRQLTALQHGTRLLEEELTQARSLLDERTEALAEAQAQLESVRIGAVPANADGEGEGKVRAEDMAVIQDELHRQTSYLRKLERDNAKLTNELGRLKERSASIAVLQEEKRALETKLTAMEGLRERVVRLEAELERARSQAQQAAVTPSTPAGTPPPIAQTHALASLRLAHAQLLSEYGTTQAALRALEARLPDLEAAETKAESLEREKGVLAERVRRAEEKVRLREGEVGGLKALLASYTAEARAVREHTPDPGSMNISLDQHHDADMQAQRIAQLEGLLGEYKAANAKLAAELNALGGDADALLASGGPGQGAGRTREALVEEVHRARERARAVEEQLKEAETQIITHLEQIDTLEQTLFELQGEIAGGRHVPPGVRVLEMRDNPARAWVDLREAAMERLRGENEALMKRLREVEARAPVQGQGEAEQETEGQGGEREDLVPRESWELVNREKMELEEVVKQKEKRLLRLKQVYIAKGAEFRDAIASILGVKLVFVPNGQVRVTSVYDLYASFVFQPTPSSPSPNNTQNQGGQQMRMQLVAQGEGGPQDLPDLMRFWIEKEQCIPGFMASVTLECYENSKRAGEAQ
ncbi:MAD-domain-containing protein [Lyophyllum atratum]|nr:MAD-domain-containing protein [Lyophyllum atratum]